MQISPITPAGNGNPGIVPPWLLPVKPPVPRPVQEDDFHILPVPWPRTQDVPHIW